MSQLHETEDSVSQEWQLPNSIASLPPKDLKRILRELKIDYQKAWHHNQCVDAMKRASINQIREAAMVCSNIIIIIRLTDNVLETKLAAWRCS
jgi:hypothetical protein